MRIVAIGDTHGRHREITLPEGDMLIHVGDYVKGATINPKNIETMMDFNEWVQEHNFKKIICIAGNHDKVLTGRGRELLTGPIEYLEDSATEFEGLSIWGTPWVPPCYGVFNKDTFDIASSFSKIPEGIDILVSHSPPWGIGDLARSGINVGSMPLLEQTLGRIKPRLHIFGHCHWSAGMVKQNSEMMVANVATAWKAKKPAVFEMDQDMLIKVQ